MGFRKWFRLWCRSFYKLLCVDNRKYKSEDSRKRERERRIKAEHSRVKRPYEKKRSARRRSSQSARNRKVAGAMLGFVAATLSIVLLPFGLLHWGYSNVTKRRKARRVAPEKSVKPRSKNKTVSSGTVVKRDAEIKAY